MPAIACSAPGKIILFGEHAVVYYRPAIAIPFLGVRVKVTALANIRGPAGQVKIDAPDINLQTTLDQLPEDDPIALVIHGVWNTLGIHSMPAVNLRFASTIPPTSGLGSSAASAVALARAVSSFIGHPLSDEQISKIAYYAEQRQHGNPSGIDNTVITYARPIYFIREKPFEFLKVGQPLSLVVANTGIASPTAEMVCALRQQWLANPEGYETWFDQIGEIANLARRGMLSGDVQQLGSLMTQNQTILQKMGISCPELDRLVDAAIRNGALGAKLSGGGGGGNMIALVRPGNEDRIADVLKQAGAVWVQTTIVPGED